MKADVNNSCTAKSVGRRLAAYTTKVSKLQQQKNITKNIFDFFLKKLLTNDLICGKIFRYCGTTGYTVRLGKSGPCKNYQTLYADMAELADAHGSGPCERKFMQVQLLLSALQKASQIREAFFVTFYTLRVL